jgi:hypothetical protein
MPLFTAVATAGLILACLFTPWGLPIGAVLVSAMLFIWFWPTDRPPVLHSEQALDPRSSEGG